MLCVANEMPYVLSIIGVTALVLIGMRKWWGWAIAFVNECLWIVFAIVTRQHGFILGALVYGTVNIMNGVKWFRHGPHIDLDGWEWEDDEEE